jgi:hypothetical protein
MAALVDLLPQVDAGTPATSLASDGTMVHSLLVATDGAGGYILNDSNQIIVSYADRVELLATLYGMFPGADWALAAVDG